MNTDQTAVLAALMAEIASAEDRGDVEFFERLLHPSFVMQHPNTMFEDRSGFIGRITAGGTRRSGPAEIHLFGNRAVAWVDVAKLEGETWNRNHNLRVFTRSAPEADWQLITWLNEPILTD